MAGAKIGANASELDANVFQRANCEQGLGYSLDRTQKNNQKTQKSSKKS